MLLYGDNPPSDEPTLELLRRPLPLEGAEDAARTIVRSALERWGWSASGDDVCSCLTAVLRAVQEAGAQTVELFAFRRAHQLTIEVHATGLDGRSGALAADRRLGVVEAVAPLWGVRPLNDGEAVWFEFRAA